MPQNPRNEEFDYNLLSIKTLWGKFPLRKIEMLEIYWKLKIVASNDELPMFLKASLRHVSFIICN